ncbi:gephyrin-like molybdotransferase receptor GlpR [Kitasatospora sp. NBC_00315]|uniref:divisome protein SepX/GlpR n=1 Tax=Kitasatospora sp. NBC_00315 TaxID=2975963 RepID=UPI003255D4AD
MSSSGLIYAVIVGAWAAYLVPMWLRRQDELNEARPTERFSTAIRLLAGRSAMERRASRALGDETRDDQTPDDRTPDDPAVGDPCGGDPSAEADAGPGPAGSWTADSDASDDGASDDGTAGGPALPAARTEQFAPAAERTAQSVDRATGRIPDRATDRAAELPGERRAGVERRARLLARRRRMVSVLFLAFALGAIFAAVAGIAFLWAPALPAALLTLYIGHLRRLERQRYEVKIDRTRAAQAAEHLRQRERRRAEGGPAAEARPEPRPAVGARPRGVRPDRRDSTGEPPHDAAHAADRGRPHLRIAADPAPHGARPGTAASALVEATDHEEWVDGMRERAAAGPDSWEPVPVPLPTYVTAPVAPRVSRGLDLGAPGTWNAGRPAEPRNTPLFDQYAEPPAGSAAPGAPAEDGYDSRPRAANE